MFYGSSEDLKKEESKKTQKILTFGEFIKQKLDALSETMEKLHKDMVDMYTHLPKSFISSSDVKKMIAAREALHRARSFLQEKQGSFTFDCFNKLIRVDCL